MTTGQDVGAAMRPFSGHTALVTGAGRRIGARIAVRLAEAGCDVVVHHRRSEAEARQVCDEARRHGVQAFALHADLADAEDRVRLLGQAEAVAGRPIRFLVNNASSFPKDRLDDVTEDALAASVRVNAWAPFDLLRQLHARGTPAAVVNILDARLDDPDADRTSYHFAKLLLAEMTRLSALRFAPGLRVNGVAPGPVLPQVDAPAGAPGPSGKGLPLGVPPSPDDIADAVLFLLAAPTVTGAVVPVDGGRHLVGPRI